MSTILRSAEINQLADLARAGASASIIGVSGSGKSNLFNHLVNPTTQRSLFSNDATNYLFLRINFHYADEQDNSLRSVFSLILDQLELTAEHTDTFGLSAASFKRIQKHHRKLIKAADDPLKVHYHFIRAIRTVMRDSNRKLVFLFDQFEQVYQDAPARLFLHLRGLREDYKYRISYFVFTRNTLLELADSNPAREEFYELLAPNLLGLKPYTLDDALTMLTSVAQRYRIPIDTGQCKQLYALTGGHAGTLRASWLAIQRNGVDQSIDSLSKHSNVRHEMNKVWNSLLVEEKQILHRIATDTALLAADQPHLSLLQLKGLVMQEKVALSSQLFQAFVIDQILPDQAIIVLDQTTRRVLIHNKPINRLPPRPYRIFECLYKNAGEFVGRDELIEAGWPEAKGGVTDDTVTQIISRLRKMLGHPTLLVTERGTGYKLITHQVVD